MSVLIRATRVNSEQRLGGAAQELAPPAPYLPPDGRGRSLSMAFNCPAKASDK